MPERDTGRGGDGHILTSAGWIEGELTTVTEGEFEVDDRAVAASDAVNFFVTGADPLETTQYLWSEFDCVRLEDRSALQEESRHLHARILERSADDHVLVGYLTNSELFVWAPVNCRAEHLLEVFVRAEVDVRASSPLGDRTSQTRPVRRVLRLETRESRGRRRAVAFGPPVGRWSPGDAQLPWSADPDRTGHGTPFWGA